MLIFYAYPILASAYFSFNNYDVLRPPVWVGLENYKELVTSTYSRMALANTLVYVLFAVPGALFTGLLYAMLLNARIHGQQVYRTTMMLPAAIPIAASAAIWIFLWNPAYGLINSLFAAVGLPWQQTWIASVSMVKWVFISMTILYGAGILVFLAGLQGVPTEVYDRGQGRRRERGAAVLQPHDPPPDALHPVQFADRPHRRFPVLYLPHADDKGRTVQWVHVLRAVSV